MSMACRQPHVGAISCAVPPCRIGQPAAAALLKRHFGPALTSRSLAQIRAIFSHPGIRTRHLAVDDPAEILHESPDQRVERFTERSVDLAARAVTGILEQTGLAPSELAGLVVSTCTGYICPGISTYLIERLGLSRRIGAYDLVGSGCSGAIPNLQVAEALLRSRTGGPVASVCVEICSAAFRMDNDLSLILSNALFADGAAAALLWDRPFGFEPVAWGTRYLPEQREAIRFVHRGGQLYNQLDTDLPELVATAAGEVVAELLSSQGLRPGDVRHWALHTGGARIIDAVAGRIGIPEERLEATRAILSEYGNMSSPTAWFVLERLQEQARPDDWCLMLAYGAGLSAHACLLRRKAPAPFRPQAIRGRDTMP